MANFFIAWFKGVATWSNFDLGREKIQVIYFKLFSGFPFVICWQLDDFIPSNFNKEREKKAASMNFAVEKEENFPKPTQYGHVRQSYTTFSPISVLKWLTHEQSKNLRVPQLLLNFFWQRRNDERRLGEWRHNDERRSEFNNTSNYTFIKIDFVQTIKAYFLNRQLGIESILRSELGLQIFQN